MAQKNNLTIQVVSIIGGILTAIFFLGFLVVASIIRTETSSLIIGCLFIITTLTISRRLTVPFLDAMNITLYIAGCALIAYGLNKSTNALFIALAITGIFTFFLSKGFILPFLSVILFIISFGSSDISSDSFLKRKTAEQIVYLNCDQQMYSYEQQFSISCLGSLYPQMHS